MPIPSALTKDSFSVQSRKKDSSGTGFPAQTGIHPAKKSGAARRAAEDGWIRSPPQDGIRDAARRQSTAVAEVKTDLRVRRKIGLSMRIPCDIG